MGSTGRERVTGFWPITWTSTEAHPGTIEVRLSADSGASFDMPVATVTGTSAGYDWDSSAASNGAACRIGIVATDAIGNTSGLTASATDFEIANDTWIATATIGAPNGRRIHAAVWTGREMVVWGGALQTHSATGDPAAYDPRTDTWSEMSATGAPSSRIISSAVWTGRELIVWGGYWGTQYLGDGVRWSP